MLRKAAEYGRRKMKRIAMSWQRSKVIDPSLVTFNKKRRNRLNKLARRARRVRRLNGL